MMKPFTHSIPALVLIAVIASAGGGLAESQTEVSARSRFQQIASRLDMGAEFFMVSDMDGILKQTFSAFHEATPARSSQEQQVNDAATRLDRFLRKNGAYGLQGAGISTMAMSDTHHRVKCYILRDYNDSALPFWRGLVGWLPRRMMAGDFLPADVDYAHTSTADPIALWNLINATYEQAADAESRAGFDALVEQISDTIGLPFEDVMVSMRDEHCVAIRMHEARGVEYLIGVSVKNDLLRGVIEAQLAGAKAVMAELVVDDITIRYATEPVMTTPFSITPALASQSGFLLVGSSREIVMDAVRSFRHKSGLVFNSEFRTRTAGLPMVNNGLVYLTPRGSEWMFSSTDAHIPETGDQPMGDAVLRDHIRDELRRLPVEKPVAFVVLNWKQGVMVMGNSSVGGRDLTRRLLAIPLTRRFQLPPLESLFHP